MSDFWLFFPLQGSVTFGISKAASCRATRWSGCTCRRRAQQQVRLLLAVALARNTY